MCKISRVFEHVKGPKSARKVDKIIIIIIIIIIINIAASSDYGPKPVAPQPLCL